MNILGKQYTIKTLDWQPISLDRDIGISVDTIFGSMRVEREHGGQYEWSYCFDEYYDEDSGYVDSETEAVNYLESLYYSRLLHALEEID